MRFITKFIPFLFFSLVTPLNQLSFSGGGAFGAVEIGILKKLVEIEPTKAYDLYTGISAGSLNAGFLSYFIDIADGVEAAEALYSGITTDQIYAKLPRTGLSIYNTAPLRETLTCVISHMPNKPAIHTLMGAVNLYTGNLDVFSFEDNSDEDKVNLMMSSSAIPMVFPPIEYGKALYCDGGTLSNELLQVEHSAGYLNITYITPYQGLAPINTTITSFEAITKRVAQIVTANFDNPIVTMNQACSAPIGEINMYYVPPEATAGYDTLNFDNGKELVEAGYAAMQHRHYVIC
jgi:hypothetical protein